MKTKLQVAREALQEICDDFNNLNDHPVQAENALKKLDSMPDENCGSCRFHRKRKSLIHECHFYPQFNMEMTSNDFCSRFEPKEKEK